MSEKLHSTLGASSSKRWLNCPASVRLIEKAPPATESEYAAEGTRAHTALEQVLSQTKIGPTLRKKLEREFGPEMVGHAIDTRDYIESERAPDAELIIEQKVDLSFIDPSMFGTTDAALVQEFGTLHVIDYKYGAGIAVDVVEEGVINSQLAFYALGTAAQFGFNFSDVKLTIAQPRAWHKDGPIRSVTVPMSELEKWKYTFMAGVALTRDANAPLAAGSWCKFCPAAPICPALAKRGLETAKLDFSPAAPEASALPDPRDMKPEALASALRAADMLDAWMSSVNGYALDFLRRGGKIPGFKLVDKRPSRQWLDAEKTEAEARKKFGNEAFETELKSPAQLEKVGGKEWVASRVALVSSGPKIAPDSDEREAVNQLALDFQSPVESGKTAKKSGKKA